MILRSIINIPNTVVNLRLSIFCKKKYIYIPILIDSKNMTISLICTCKIVHGR